MTALSFLCPCGVQICPNFPLKKSRRDFLPPGFFLPYLKEFVDLFLHRIIVVSGCRQAVFPVSSVTPLACDYFFCQFCHRFSGRGSAEFSVDRFLDGIVIISCCCQSVLPIIAISPLPGDYFLGDGVHALFRSGSGTAKLLIDLCLDGIVVISCFLQLPFPVISIAPLSCNDLFCDLCIGFLCRG